MTPEATFKVHLEGARLKDGAIIPLSEFLAALVTAGFRIQKVEVEVS